MVVRSKGYNALDLVTAIKQCSKARDLERGKQLHLEAIQAGSHTNKYVANALINMYSKCSSMLHARQVFDQMIYRDAVSWSSLILGYAESGSYSVAVNLFANIDCEPTHVTYLAVLKACVGLSERQTCVNIHDQVRARGFESNILVASSLVNMYSKCGSMECAREVFDGMVYKDVVTWNALILGYVESGECSVAMELFGRMDCEPTHVTYLALLKACAWLGSLDKGIGVHKQVEVRGFDSNIAVGNALVDMYSKCGSMPLAWKVSERMVRKDVVTWTCLIKGYVRSGESSVAMELFEGMDCEPDCCTYVAALNACADLANLEKGVAIHQQVKERGIGSNVVVANTLVDMYSKCRSMPLAREVFETMIRKDVITWNCLILGYVESKEFSTAMDLFASMECEPDSITYIAALKACAGLESEKQNIHNKLHGRICRLGLEEDPAVATALVDFYGKCGYMSIAEEVFNSMHCPEMVSWTVLIAGYSSLGDSFQVFSLTKKMQETSLEMNNITFTCILTACSHTGAVEEGKMYFESMYKFGVIPTLEHYSCMVDMLCRANKLEEALLIINSMPLKADSVTWRTLLGACKKWKNLKVGKVAFDALVAGDPVDAAVAYVLLGDIYKSLSMHQDCNLRTCCFHIKRLI